jgi:hypothetical protein
MNPTMEWMPFTSGLEFCLRHLIAVRLEKVPGLLRLRASPNHAALCAKMSAGAKVNPIHRNHLEDGRLGVVWPKCVMPAAFDVAGKILAAAAERALVECGHLGSVPDWMAPGKCEGVVVSHACVQAFRRTGGCWSDKGTAQIQIVKKRLMRIAWRGLRICSRDLNLRHRPDRLAGWQFPQSIAEFQP